MEKKLADREKLVDDGTVRKTYYGDGEQPWDIMKRLGWTHYNAAGNVLKYIRRVKDDPADDLKKAQWYYSELRKLMGASTLAQNLHDQLMLELTAGEKHRLKGY